MNTRRLYRSRYDRQLTGVAGGMAEYLEIDPTVVRILWILSAFLGGFTIVLYIILAFVVPLEPASMPAAGSGRAPGSWQAPGQAGDVPPTGATGSEPTGATDSEPTGATAGDAPEADGSATVGGPAEAAGYAGWQAAGGDAYTGWTAPPYDATPDGARGGGGGIVLGVLLVVFGAIALTSMLVPSWAGSAALGPAFVLALGVALVVGATRRTASER